MVNGGNLAEDQKPGLWNSGPGYSVLWLWDVDASCEGQKRLGVFDSDFLRYIERRHQWECVFYTILHFRSISTVMLPADRPMNVCVSWSIPMLPETGENWELEN